MEYTFYVMPALATNSYGLKPGFSGEFTHDLNVVAIVKINFA